MVGASSGSSGTGTIVARETDGYSADQSQPEEDSSTAGFEGSSVGCWKGALGSRM